MKAVVLRKSTGEILNYDYNVADPTKAISGLDPDLEVLLYYTPYEKPDFDNRIHKLVETHEVTEIAHPDYSLYNQYLVTYSTEKRTNDELNLAVENAESFANSDLMPQNKLVKLISLALAAVIRELNGVTPGAREEAVKDEMVARAIKMYKNDEELQRKLQQIIDNVEPDLDAGWENTL